MDLILIGETVLSFESRKPSLNSQIVTKVKRNIYGIPKGTIFSTNKKGSDWNCLVCGTFLMLWVAKDLRAQRSDFHAHYVV